MHSCCADLLLLVVRVYSHIMTSCTCMAQVTKHIVCVSPKNTHISSRTVVHLATFDDTKHGHSFLSFPEPVFQRAEPLRRSTATAEWRFGWAPTLYGLWAQAACWTPGLQALHRRRSAHWTRGFTCQTLDLPPIDHSVKLRFSGKHRDTAPGIGLRRWATSCSAGFTTVPKVYHSARENLMSSSSQDSIGTGTPVALFSSQIRLNPETFSDRENFS